MFQYIDEDPFQSKKMSPTIQKEVLGDAAIVCDECITAGENIQYLAKNATI